MTILTCLGDSITDCEHCFSRDFLGNGYVKMLSDCLKRDGSDYQVRNYGTDGFTINRLLQRIQGDSDFTSDINISDIFNMAIKGKIDNSSILKKVVSLLRNAG